MLVLPILYIIILWIDYRLVAPSHTSTRGERILYRVLIILALISAVPTGVAQRLDHMGVSLSGLVSLFSR